MHATSRSAHQLRPVSLASSASSILVALCIAAMGHIEKAPDALPTSQPVEHSTRRARLPKAFHILVYGLICFVLYHTDFQWPQLLSLSRPSRQAWALGNEACPQAPPFRLPPSDSALDLGRDKDRIQLPSGPELAQLLSGAIQIDTTVGDEWPTVAQDPARWEAVFAPFHEYLRSSFPLIYAAGSPVTVERVNEWGLVYTLAGTNASLAPLVLMAHQDVVPVEPETVSSWTHPPFSGFVDDELGLVWGRGAGDCKATIISILATFESVLRAGYQPGRTLVGSFGFDEESAGTQGGAQLATFLHQRYGDNGVAMIVDEGGGIDLQLGFPVAAPTVAEKGYLDARITVSTPGGHSSAPREHTSIGLLAQLVTAIEAHPYQPAIHMLGKNKEQLNPALQYLQCTRDAPRADAKLARALKKLERTQRQLAASASLRRWSRKWLEKKLVRQAKQVVARMDREQQFGFQTTQAVDLISGGVKINALPEQATAVINHRIDVSSSTAKVRQHVYSTLRPVAERLGLAIEGEGDEWGFIQRGAGANKIQGTLILSDAFESALEPAPFTPLGEARPWVLLQGVMRAVWTDILVAPDLMGGNTDTKSYWNLTQHIFRFTPGSDQPFPLAGQHENIHTVDERTTIHGLVKATQFYTLLIQAVSAQVDL